MPKLSRKGDTDSGGGKIKKGAKTVFCDKKPVGLHTSPITSHGSHSQVTTTKGSPSVFAENKPVLRVGSGNSCGHPINKGSDTVFVE